MLENNIKMLDSVGNLLDFKNKIQQKKVFSNTCWTKKTHKSLKINYVDLLDAVGRVFGFFKLK